jgi:hypothetical protein
MIGLARQSVVPAVIEQALRGARGDPAVEFIRPATNRSRDFATW